MGNRCAFWPQQTLCNSTRFSCPTRQVRPCQALPHSTVQVARTRDFHLLVAGDGFYSLDKRLRDIREVRDEERLITLLVWRHNNEASPWEPTRSGSHRPGSKFFGKLTGPTQRVYAKARHYQCLLLVRTFPSFPLGVERKGSPLLIDTSSLESQIQVRNGI